jgi:hypothetical protein
MQALQSVRGTSSLLFNCSQCQRTGLLLLVIVISSVQFETAAGSQHGSAQQQLLDYRKLNVEYFLKVCTSTNRQKLAPETCCKICTQLMLHDCMRCSTTLLSA